MNYLTAQVDSIHKQWVATLRDIRSVTGKVAQDLHFEHLADLHRQACILAKDQRLHIQHRGSLQHIIQRTPEEHLLTIKPDRSKVTSKHQTLGKR